MTRSYRLGLRDDGSVALFDERGQAVPDHAPITTSAGVLAAGLTSHCLAGVAIGRKAAGKDAEAATAAVIDAAAQAVSATARAVRPIFAAGAQAGAQAGVRAGAQAGARAVLKSSRTRKDLRRDQSGQVTAVIESREPVPAEEPHR